MGKGDYQMNVVYALTRNVYDWLLPSITSLFKHNPDVNVTILCEDDALDLPFPVKVINVSDQKYFAPTSINFRNQFTYINLLKVAYPEILPKMQKVIHLDIDTIITGPLDEMWNVDVKGKWFAAAQETYGKYKPFGERYYNMGVALINLQQMRKDKIVPTMVDYLATVYQPWADQDAWNKYGIEQDKIAELPLRFNENCMTGYTDSPVIVHYCSIGDWFTNHTMPRHEYLEQYKQ